MLWYESTSRLTFKQCRKIIFQKIRKKVIVRKVNYIFIFSSKSQFFAQSSINFTCLQLLFWTPDLVVELGVVQGQPAVNGERLEGLLVRLCEWSSTSGLFLGAWFVNHLHHTNDHVLWSCMFMSCMIWKRYLQKKVSFCLFSRWQSLVKFLLWSDFDPHPPRRQKMVHFFKASLILVTNYCASFNWTQDLHSFLYSLPEWLLACRGLTWWCTQSVGQSSY